MLLGNLFVNLPNGTSKPTHEVAAYSFSRGVKLIFDPKVIARDVLSTYSMPDEPATFGDVWEYLARQVEDAISALRKPRSPTSREWADRGR